MESVDYEPIWTVMAQIVVLILNAVLYARQKSAVDVEKRDRGEVKLGLDLVRQVAEAAKQEAQAVNGEKYEKVHTKLLELITELSGCKAENKALWETVTSLSNKLASRERADRRATKAAPPESEEPEDTRAGEDPLEFLKRSGKAVPLPINPPASPAPSTFGKVAR